VQNRESLLYEDICKDSLLIFARLTAVNLLHQDYLDGLLSFDATAQLLNAFFSCLSQAPISAASQIVLLQMSSLFA